MTYTIFSTEFIKLDIVKLSEHTLSSRLMKYKPTQDPCRGAKQINKLNDQYKSRKISFPSKK